MSTTDCALIIQNVMKHDYMSTTECDKKGQNLILVGKKERKMSTTDCALIKA